LRLMECFLQSLWLSLVIPSWVADSIKTALMSRRSFH